MQLHKWFAIAVLAGCPIAGSASAALAAPSPRLGMAVDPGGPLAASTQFRVSDQTEIPGKTLKPGSYNIHIVDHLADRMIVQVDRNGKTESTFLALPKSNLPTPASQGVILIGGGKHGHSAVRGFAFPNGVLAEFVYPKAAAVDLAKANNTTIPAIDPASEGMAKANDLSDTDRQMVTLWMLSPSPVGPGDSGPGITAARYQAATSAPANREASGNTDVADGKVPVRPASRVRPAALRSTAALPHTASGLPLVWAVGLGSALGAALLTRRRRASVQA